MSSSEVSLLPSNLLSDSVPELLEGVILPPELKGGIGGKDTKSSALENLLGPELNIVLDVATLPGFGRLEVDETVEMLGFCGVCGVRCFDAKGRKRIRIARISV